MSNTLLYFGTAAFRFMYDPYTVSWTYTLKTRKEDTLGGKVIQILGANIDNLKVTGVAGSFAELQRTAETFRQMLLWQRDTNQMARFVYETRGYNFTVLGASFSFEESLTTISYPFTMNFKIQEDLSGVAVSQSVSQELSDIHDGIGYTESEYNMPEGSSLQDQPFEDQNDGDTGYATTVTGKLNGQDDKVYTTPTGSKYV